MSNLLRSLPLLTILLMLGGAGVAIWWLPQKQVESLQHRIDALDRQKPTTFAELEKLAQQEKARIDAENTARAALIQGAGGLFAATAAYIAWRNLLATQEKQVAERFSKAVEHLGNDNIHVRLGGIYALEQIAKDAEEKYYWRVIETLAAYVRERSPYQPDSAIQGTENVTPTANLADSEPQPSKPKQDTTSPPIDIQSIITILSRCQPSRGMPNGSRPINLCGTDLHRLHVPSGSHLKGIEFSGANLHHAFLLSVEMEWVSLYHANLEGAILIQTKLNHVDFSHANLQNAVFSHAKSKSLELDYANLQNAKLDKSELQGASFIKANLQNANFGDAKLNNTHFYEANMQGANLIGVNLQKAMLRGVNLQKADLRSANLRGADLSEVDLRGADLRKADLGGADLRLANLEGANLEATVLHHTQFSVPPKDFRLFGTMDAIGLTWEQVKQAESYKGALLPSYLLAPQTQAEVAEATPTDPPLSQD